MSCEEDDLTVSEARARLLWQCQAGKMVICPCCGGKVKKYKRKLNHINMRCLFWLVRRYFETGQPASPTQEGPRHVANNGGELARLIHWGFIEPVYTPDTSKRCSGLWLPTKLGIDFAMGRTTANAAYFVFINNTVTGVDRTQVTAQEALGTKFNYEELMNEPGFDEAKYRLLTAGAQHSVAALGKSPRRLPHIYLSR